MAETISGALSDLGRTFRRGMEYEATAADRRLREQQLLSNERLALEGLRLQGERDVATATLRQAQSEANIRQGQRRLELAEEQADVAEQQGQQRLDILGAQQAEQVRSNQAQEAYRQQTLQIQRDTLANAQRLGDARIRLFNAQAGTAEEQAAALRDQNEAMKAQVHVPTLLEGMKADLVQRGMPESQAASWLERASASMQAFGIDVDEYTTLRSIDAKVKAISPLLTVMMSTATLNMTPEEKSKFLIEQWIKSDQLVPLEEFMPLAQAMLDDPDGTTQFFKRQAFDLQQQAAVLKAQGHKAEKIKQFIDQARAEQNAQFYGVFLPSEARDALREVQQKATQGTLTNEDFDVIEQRLRQYPSLNVDIRRRTAPLGGDDLAISRGAQIFGSGR